MNNKNIKSNSNKNKINKPIIFIGLFILLCIICISILFIISKNRNNSNDEYNYNYGENYSKSDLPDLSQINPDNNPILYDFVNGSIGYKIDLDSNGCYFNDLGNFYVQ